MRSRAVVLSYPGHFLLTWLTVKSIEKHISGISHITVIADDISYLTWENYIQDCKDLYAVEVIPASDYEIFSQFKDNPWIRQQIIKMSLDKIVPNESVFFTDGDVVFYYDVTESCVPYTLVKYSGVPLTERDPGPGEVTSQQLYYVQKTLNFPSKGIFCNNKLVSTSGAPFRDIDNITLKRLRNYIEKTLNTDFYQYHLDISLDTRYSVSEWEILEQYKRDIEQQKLNLVYYPPYAIDNLPPTTHKGQNWFASCFDSDVSFSYQWWLDQQVPDLEKYWQKLPATKWSKTA